MHGLLAAVGLVIGLALYAMLLAMVLGARRARSGFDGVALATAVLGLTWYLCALAMDAFPYFAPELIAVCAFSALGFLPAVVVHSVLRGGPAGSRIRTGLRTMAYGASSAAAIFQFEAALNGHPIPSVLGFQLLTVLFVGMLAPLAWLTRGQPGSRRALWAVSLAAFAVSALHLSQYNETAAWPIELIGHNASIPLAVAILYQDYPFAFADLFVKRALTLRRDRGGSVAVVLDGGRRSRRLPSGRASRPSPDWLRRHRARRAVDRAWNELVCRRDRPDEARLP